jgi:RNA polymerase sigma-70 factor (ECF subfamily)
MEETFHTIERIFMESSGRIMATLIGDLGDFDLAEDAMQDAFIVAMEKWSQDGLPPNPGGWIMTTARRKAIDRLRRSKTYQEKTAVLQHLADLTQTTAETTIDMDTVADERLKLMFTCCHPALPLRFHWKRRSL